MDILEEMKLMERLDMKKKKIEIQECILWLVNRLPIDDITIKDLNHLYTVTNQTFVRMTEKKEG